MPTVWVVNINMECDVAFNSGSGVVEIGDIKSEIWRDHQYGCILLTTIPTSFTLLRDKIFDDATNSSDTFLPARIQ